jgi:hypothetical protein
MYPGATSQVKGASMEAFRFGSRTPERLRDVVGIFTTLRSRYWARRARPLISWHQGRRPESIEQAKNTNGRNDRLRTRSLEGQKGSQRLGFRLLAKLLETKTEISAISRPRWAGGQFAVLVRGTFTFSLGDSGVLLQIHTVQISTAKAERQNATCDFGCVKNHTQPALSSRPQVQEVKERHCKHS